MNKQYEPELGQALFGNPSMEHGLPEFAEACFWHLWHEIERVFCNRHQREFDTRGHDDPNIPGITVRPYCWCGDDCENCLQPNFMARADALEVQIKWYKYPGRGMSCNVDWPPEKWAKWLETMLEVVRATDPTIAELEQLHGTEG